MNCVLRSTNMRVANYEKPASITLMLIIVKISGGHLAWQQYEHDGKCCTYGVECEPRSSAL